MNFLELTVSYGVITVLLLLPVIILGDKATQEDDLQPEEVPAGDNYMLDLPDYGYWRLNFQKWIETLTAEIASTRKELANLETEAMPVLKRWELTCAECRRLTPGLRRLLPLFFFAGAATWFALVSAGFAMLLRSSSVQRIYDLTPLDVFTPNLPLEARACAVGVTAAAVVYWMLCLVVQAIGRVGSRRLTAYQQWLLRQNIRRPQLHSRLEWLEQELDRIRRNRDEALVLDRTETEASA